MDTTHMAFLVNRGKEDKTDKTNECDFGEKKEDMKGRHAMPKETS